MASPHDETAQRLEMLVVARWLEAGRPEDGRVPLRLEDALDELDLAPGRVGLMRLMAAMGDLEARRLVDVSWPTGITSGEAELTLADELRAEARRLFG